MPKRVISLIQVPTRTRNQSSVPSAVAGVMNSRGFALRPEKTVRPQGLGERRSNKVRTEGSTWAKGTDMPVPLLSDAYSGSITQNVVRNFDSNANFVPCGNVGT